ncbi:HAD-IB family hydrolase [Streptomyces sp. NPDC029554]|uniref:HAD family hydrolase n=1 Tax=Streptomyces sp. NPDC029554 TaxID=3155126 RepID=UPI0033D136C4
MPGDVRAGTPGAAFFDVDGTLTTGTTLFRFLEYRFAVEGRPPQAYTEERQRLRAMTEAGVCRSRTNRAYFASYARLGVSYVADLAEDWFRTELESGGFLHDSAVAALRGHQAAGEPVVLASGSFPALLAPLARLLDVDAVLATEPETLLGHYTGDATVTMIGATKADAVRSWCAEHGIDPAAATAYGDHVSDLPMLRATGRGVVVGGDRELRAVAARQGWRLLPAPPAAPPLRLPEPLWTARAPSAAARRPA